MQDVDLLSVEAMLSVPTDIIFRKVQNKPLLTRTEGECFVRIAMLSHELDACLHFAEQILRQRRQSREIRNKMDCTCNPTLRPLTILIRVFEGQLTPSLVGVQKAISCIMMDLSSCSSLLRQSAEQNWSVAESLSDAVGGTLAGHSSRLLARDKRNVAELEEELAKRIDSLLGIASLDFSEERQRMKSCERTQRNLFGGSAYSDLAVLSEPMQDVCSRLFGCAIFDRVSGTVAPERHLTQPDDARTRRSLQLTMDMDGHENESRIFEMEESQSSFRRQSNAAETLASLAGVSKPLYQH